MLILHKCNPTLLMVAKVFYEEPPFATDWEGGGESNADIICNPYFPHCASYEKL